MKNKRSIHFYVICNSQGQNAKWYVACPEESNTILNISACFCHNLIILYIITCICIYNTCKSIIFRQSKLKKKALKEIKIKKNKKSSDCFTL